MSFLLIITMAAVHLAHPEFTMDKFPGSHPDQDAESLIQLIGRKINFAFADAPTDAGQLTTHTFRKKFFFAFYSEAPQPNGNQQSVKQWILISSLTMDLTKRNSKICIPKDCNTAFNAQNLLP